MYLCKKKSSGERSCGSLFTPASRLDRLEDFGGGEGRGGESGACGPSFGLWWTSYCMYT